MIIVCGNMTCNPYYLYVVYSNSLKLSELKSDKDYDKYSYHRYLQTIFFYIYILCLEMFHSIKIKIRVDIVYKIVNSFLCYKITNNTMLRYTYSNEISITRISWRQKNCLILKFRMGQ